MTLLISSRASRYATGYFLVKHSNLYNKCQYDLSQLGGQRNWVQVICNDEVAAFASALYLVEVAFGERPIDTARDFNASIFSMALIGSLACSCGDFWASEIDSVFSKNALLVKTKRQVPTGTNTALQRCDNGWFIGKQCGSRDAGSRLLSNHSSNHDLQIDKFSPQWPIVVTEFLLWVTYS